METKYNLRISKMYDVNDLSTAVITSLSSEYIIDTIKDTIKRYSGETNLQEFISKFADLIDESYNVSFSSMEGWLAKKTDTNSQLLQLIVDLDKYLAENKAIKKDSLIMDFQTNFAKYLMPLAGIKITEDSIDLGDVEIKKEYITSTLEQLRLLDEGVTLSTLMGMSLEFSPMNTKEDKNKFVEKKLSSINKIATSIETTFENDYDKLLSQIVKMYQKFYNICYSGLNDGEKAEKTRQVIKEINPHRLVLDELENKLSKANELKRQLTLHKNQLTKKMQDKESELDSVKAQGSDDFELMQNSLDSASAVTNSYVDKIDYSIDRINTIESKITEHYKVLDMLENALKPAIPAEEELKRYSAVTFKIQELIVKLEQNKTQMTSADKDLKVANKGAKIGLETILTYSKEIKDVFVRNSMIVAIFKAVDALINFAESSNKAVALDKMQKLTAKVSKFSELEQKFRDDLVIYRRLSNDLVRDISIILGKGVTEEAMVSIVDLIDKYLTQLETLSKNLNQNNQKQIDVLSTVLQD